MTLMLTGQLILGTDKRNPLFTVYVQAEEEQEQLHVYYGLELLEVVSAERNDPNFKMLVGRLYNAGVSLRVLQQTCQTDPKTIQRWGRALRSRDVQELVRVLGGRQARRKLSLEIKAYVRARWADLISRGQYGISQRLRQEIQAIFGVKLSQETLRPLVGQLKRARSAAAPPLTSQPTTAEGFPQSSQSAPNDQAVSSKTLEQTCARSATNLTPDSVASSGTTEWALEAAPQTLWCDHLGMLLFAPVLVAVAQVLDRSEALFKQWLASLLLGALNIEQTKFLNWPDLSRLLGSVVRFPHPQRQELERVASPANMEALARFNALQIGADAQSQSSTSTRTPSVTPDKRTCWKAGVQRFDGRTKPCTATSSTR